MRRLLTILLLLPVMASATNHYFSSSTGSDANSCTLASPCQTLAKASSISLSPGDSVLFKRGDTFFGELHCNTQGSSSLSIHYDAYGTGANPIITGWVTLTTWTSLGSNKYEAYCGSCAITANMVQFNGNNQWMGRTPNKGATNDGWSTYQSGTSTSVTDASLNSLPVSNGALVVLRTNNFVTDTATITGFAGHTVSFAATLNGTPTANFGYFFERDPATLDQLGEWYWNGAVDSLQMDFAGSTPGSNTINIAGADTLVSISASYITFKNINVIGANKDGICIPITNVRQDTVAYCKIQFCGVNGIEWVGNHSNNAITNDSILDINNTAILAPGTGNNLAYIANNVIKRAGIYSGMGAGLNSYDGIIVKGGYSIIRSNVVDSVGYNAIEKTSGSVGDSIDHNYALHYNMTKNDGAGIYAGTSNDHGYIGYNILGNGVGYYYGTTSTAPAYTTGIYLDAGASYWRVENNTLYNNPWAGIFLHYAKNNNIENNVSFANLYQIWYQTESNDSIRNDTIMYNQFVALDSPQLCAAWQPSGRTDFNQWGIIDSNYYARPSNDNLTFENQLTSTFYNLAGWQSLSSMDAHSHKSPVAVSTSADVTLTTNPSSAVYSPYLQFHSVDPPGNQYAPGPLSIPAYSSLVLIQYTPWAVPVSGEYQDGFIFPGGTMKTAGGGSTGQGSAMTISNKGFLSNIHFNDAKTRTVLLSWAGLHTFYVLTAGPTGTFTGDTLWATGLNDGHWQGSSTAPAQNSFVPILVDHSGAALTNINGGWASATPGLIDTTSWVMITKTDGTLWRIGNSTGGLTGDGTNGNSAHVDSFFVQVPAAAFGGHKIVKIRGMFFPIALDDAGNVYTWGNQNYIGWQLGQAGDYRTPHTVSLGGLAALDITSNSLASFAITSDHHLWGWSYYSALMGINVHWSGTSNHNTPTDITSSQGLTGLTYSSITNIEETFYATMSDGSMRSWGDNPEGTGGVSGDAGYQINMWATTPTPFNYDGGQGENIIPLPLDPFAGCATTVVSTPQGGYYQRDGWIVTYDGTNYHYYHIGRNKNAVGLFYVNGDPTFNQEADYPDWHNDTIPTLRDITSTSYTLAEAAYCTANPGATACHANFNPPTEGNPTVNAGSNQTIAITTASLSGSATPASTYSITQYRWSGPCGVVISNPFSASPTVSNLPTGVTTMTLKAWDNYNKSATSTMTITVSQTGYYFDSAGTGSACTQAAPCSMSMFNSLYSVASAGDTFYIHRGRAPYQYELVANSFGAAGNPIVVKPYGTGALPIVGGLLPQTGWTAVAGLTNVWEVPYSGSWLNLAVYNGALATQARTPNLTTGYFIPTSMNQTSITDAAHAGMVTSGTKIAARTSAYTIDSAHAGTPSGGTFSVSPSFTYNPSTTGGNGWMIMNNTPDTAGEWQDTLGQFRVYSVGSPSGTWQVPAEDTILLDEGGHQEWDSIDFRGGNKANVILAFQANADIHFKGCISEYGIDGYQFRSDGADTIIGGQVQHLTNNGKLKVNANNYNNYDSAITVYDIGILPGMGRQGNQQPVYAGWVGGDSASTVVNLTVDSTGAAGIINYGSGFKVNYNSIRYVCQILEDQAGIYTWMTSGTLARWREIIGNYIHISGSPMSHNGSALDMSAGGVGIYLDNYSYIDSVVGNTIDSCNSTALYDHGPTNVFSGNLTYNSGFASLLAYEITGGPTITGLTVSGNSFNAINPSTYVMYLETANNDIATFGTFNNNTFNHQNATSVFYKKDNTGGGVSMNFATWKSTYSGYEPSSTFAQRTLSLAGNPLFSTQTYVLPGIYQDLNGKYYRNKITLPQLSGKVLQLINPGQSWWFKKHP